jgi:hypothetical protein
MLAQHVSGAEMRLVAVGKEPSTFRAFPQTCEIHIVSRSLTEKSYRTVPLKLLASKPFTDGVVTLRYTVTS